MQDKLESDSLVMTEKEKKTDKYLIDQIKHTINSCSSVDKDKWIEAYNLRNGVRDAKDFEYLWKAYGIEFPSQMRHIPTLRSIFDALLGQYIRRPFKYNITCADTDSITHMMDQYRDQILSDIRQYYENQLTAAEAMAKSGQAYEHDPGKLAKRIEKIKEKYESGGFQSDLEKLSSIMLRWSLQKFKLKGELITMCNDFITSGQAYEQVKVLQVGKQPLIRVINPLQIFYTKGPNTKFIKNLDRVMVKEQMPASIVWSLYGHKMKKEDADKFLKDFGKYIIDSELEIVGYDFGDIEGANMPPYTKGINIPMIDVHYVEWKANTKVPVHELEESSVESDDADRLARIKTKYKYRLDRFEGVQIGKDIFVDYGKSKFIIRDPDNEQNVDLTINGICFNDRNGEPYSLVLKTKDIADKIDILHYHAENLLAISGTKAITVNYPDIPAWMGADPIQRIMKWAGYLKQGLAVVDTSQEGNGVGKFANMGDVDLSVSNAIVGIFSMLDNLEATAYKITGVPRQAIGAITESDGKGTSQLAIQSSEVVTEPMFTAFDELAEQFLTDVVNACRICYPDGIQGQLLLGETGQKIFKIKNKKLLLAHLNVFVNGQGDVQRDIDEVKQVAYKLIDNQMLDVETAIDMVTIKSLTELKQAIKNSVKKQGAQEKEQLMQKLEQVQKEFDSANKALQDLQKKSDGVKEAELQIKQQELAEKSRLKDKELDNNQIFNSDKTKLDERRVELEALELADGGNDKEIRNN